MPTSSIPSPQARILEIDYLRGIAIILIILGHAVINFPINLYQTVPWCHFLKDLVYCFHVPALFLVAGFCYHCSNYKSFALNKCKRIFVPYLVFEISWSLLHIFASSLTDPRNPTTLLGLFLRFFNGGGYWFLWALFFMFLIWPLLEKICSNKVFWLFFFMFLWIAGVQPKMFGLDGMIRNYVYFIMGTILATPSIKQKILYSSPRQKWIALGASLLALSISLAIWGVTRHQGYPLRAFSFIFFVGSCIWVIAPYLKKCYLGNTISKLLITSSYFSLQLYLFDSYWQTAGRTLLCTFLKIYNPFIIVPFIFITNMTLTLLICNYLLPRIPFLQRACGIVRK